MLEDQKQRQYWIETLLQITDPVLTAFSERRLKATMPVEGKVADRSYYSNLEVLGRTLLGMAPWLETKQKDKEEELLRLRYAELAREAIDAGTDPASPDYCQFTNEGVPGGQPLVDAAFLCHAILRAPNELWHKLDLRVKKNLVDALKNTRVIRPGRCNWLLFSAMIEAALYFMGEKWDKMRVDYAIYQHEQWYKGDGIYGDGPNFCWDYYNSFVIQPMLVDIIHTIGSTYADGAKMEDSIVKRAKRYARIQEMLISPEGTFPPIGRSIAYRCGAFQLMAQLAFQKQLPEEITPAQVRCALTAVIKNCIDAPNTFDENGWLRIGLCGWQPDLGEGYISTASLYLCTAAFLPLGLDADDEFWNSEYEPWSSKKIWSGENMNADHSIPY